MTEQKPIIVIEKATGGYVAITSMKQFDSNVHAKRPEDLEAVVPAVAPTEIVCVNCGEKALTKVVKEEKKPKKGAVGDAQSSPEPDATEPTTEIAPDAHPQTKERYDELKAKRAWMNPNLKEEFYALQQKFGK